MDIIIFGVVLMVKKRRSICERI